jgi:hypothetical protein
MATKYKHEPKLSASLRAACGEAYRGTSGSVLMCGQRQIDALVKRGLARHLVSYTYLLTEQGDAVGHEWQMKVLFGPDCSEDERVCPTCNGDRYTDDVRCGSCSGRGVVYGPPPGL